MYRPRNWLDHSSCDKRYIRHLWFQESHVGMGEDLLYGRREQKQETQAEQYATALGSTQKELPTKAALGGNEIPS